MVGQVVVGWRMLRTSVALIVATAAVAVALVLWPSIRREASIENRCIKIAGSIALGGAC